MNPRRYPNNEIIQEWSRRQVRYIDATKRLRYVFYIALLVTVLIVIFDFDNLRLAASLFFGVGVLLFIILQILTSKFLRCPNCDCRPGGRGDDYFANICGRCNNYLTEGNLPNT